MSIDQTVQPAAPLRPEERINAYTAQLDHPGEGETPIGDPEEEEGLEPMELTPANEADAKALGYVAENGLAKP